MDLLAVLPEGPSTTSMAARVQNIVELYGVQPPPPNMLALSLFLLLHLWDGLQPRIGLSAANICFNGLLLEYLRSRKAPTGHSPRRRSVTVSATAADLLQPADSRLDDRFLEIFKLMSRL